MLISKYNKDNTPKPVPVKLTITEGIACPYKSPELEAFTKEPSFVFVSFDSLNDETDEIIEVLGKELGPMSKSYQRKFSEYWAKNGTGSGQFDIENNIQPFLVTLDGRFTANRAEGRLAGFFVVKNSPTLDLVKSLIAQRNKNIVIDDKTKTPRKMVIRESKACPCDDYRLKRFTSDTSQAFVSFESPDKSTNAMIEFLGAELGQMSKNFQRRFSEYWGKNGSGTGKREIQSPIIPYLLRSDGSLTADQSEGTAGGFFVKKRHDTFEIVNKLMAQYFSNVIIENKTEPAQALDIIIAQANEIPWNTPQLQSLHTDPSLVFMSFENLDGNTDDVLGELLHEFGPQSKNSMPPDSYIWSPKSYAVATGTGHNPIQHSIETFLIDNNGSSLSGQKDGGNRYAGVFVHKDDLKTVQQFIAERLNHVQVSDKREQRKQLRQ